MKKEIVIQPNKLTFGKTNWANTVYQLRYYDHVMFVIFHIESEMITGKFEHVDFGRSSYFELLDPFLATTLMGRYKLIDRKKMIRYLNFYNIKLLKRCGVAI